jgi:hypothetical protein
MVPKAFKKIVMDYDISPWLEEVCLAFIWSRIIDNSWQNTEPKQRSLVPFEEGQENASPVASSL